MFFKSLRKKIFYYLQTQYLESILQKICTANRAILKSRHKYI